MTRLTALLALLTAAPVAAQLVERDAVFDASVVVAGDQQRLDRLCDFDADGHVDAIGYWRLTTSGRDHVVTGYRNDGRGALSPAWSVTFTAQSYGYDEIVVANLDGDQRDDFVLVVAREIVAYTSRGTALPGRYSLGSFGDYVLDVAAGDFDGDGLDDVVVQSRSALELFVNDGTRLVHADTVPLSGAFSVRAGELTGDARADALVTSGDGAKIYSVEQGRLAHRMDIAHGIDRWQRTHSVIGDIDADGDEDVVLFWEYYGGNFVVLRRTGPAAFATEAARTGGPATGFADVDGDGDLDGVCCGGGGGNYPNYNLLYTAFQVSLNDGSGGFAPSQVIGGLGAQHIAGAADLDGDGDVDLVGGRCVYFARGGYDAAIQPEVAVRGADREWFADVDDDGDVDLVPSITGSYINPGDGSWARGPAHRIPAFNDGTALHGPGWHGDFDGDGDLDLVVGHMRGETVLGMRLLAQVGGGNFVDGGAASPAGVHFQYYLNTRAPYFGHEGIAADADGDGDVDIVRVSWGASQLWRNDGNGFFRDAGTLPIAKVTDIVDVDRDGFPDLVGMTVAQYLPDAIEIHFGAGDGTFPRSVQLPAWVESTGWSTSFTDRFAVADADGDGDVDVLTIDRSVQYGVFRLFINDGNGGFTGTLFDGDRVFSSTGPAYARLGDVDGDGTVDAILDPVFRAHSCSKLFLSANGAAFGRQVVQSLHAFDLLDIDGDADLDAISLRAVRNATHHGVAGGSTLQHGDARAGLGRMVPLLSAIGPFRVGEQATTRLRGAPGGTLVSYQFGLGPGPFVGFPLPGMVSYAHPYLFSVTVALTGRWSEAGTGGFDLRYTVPPGVAGTTLYQQVHVFDPSVPPFSLSYTNGLVTTFGR